MYGQTGLAAGFTQGMQIATQGMKDAYNIRADREERRMKAEQHELTLQQGAQQIEQRDLQIESLQMELEQQKQQMAQAANENKKRSVYDGITTAMESQDPRFLQAALRQDPEMLEAISGMMGQKIPLNTVWFGAKDVLEKDLKRLGNDPDGLQIYYQNPTNGEWARADLEVLKAATGYIGSEQQANMLARRRERLEQEKIKAETANIDRKDIPLDGEDKLKAPSSFSALNTRIFENTDNLESIPEDSQEWSDLQGTTVEYMGKNFKFDTDELIDNVANLGHLDKSLGLDLLSIEEMSNLTPQQLDEFVAKQTSGKGANWFTKAADTVLKATGFDVMGVKGVDPNQRANFAWAINGIIKDYYGATVTGGELQRAAEMLELNFGFSPEHSRATIKALMEKLRSNILHKTGIHSEATAFVFRNMSPIRETLARADHAIKSLDSIQKQGKYGTEESQGSFLSGDGSKGNPYVVSSTPSKEDIDALPSGAHIQTPAGVFRKGEDGKPVRVAVK